MHSKYFAALAAWILLTTGSLFAEQEVPKGNYSQYYAVGLGAFGLRGVGNYKSTSDSIECKRSGSYILHLGYEYFVKKEVYGSLNFDFRGYESKNKTLSNGAALNRSDMFYYLQGRLGYVFDVGMHFTLTPFLGLGTSNTKLAIKRSASLPTSDAYFARQWNYAIVGLQVNGVLSDVWELGMRVQIMPTLSDPKMRSNVVGVETDKTKGRANYSLEVPITYNFLQTRSALRFVPFYNSQNFGTSKSSTPLFANHSAFKSNTIGARVDYLYRF